MELRPEDRIGPGTSLEAALRAFHESANKPETIFSTEHWIQPKLARLRVLLADPISDDQAQALLAVLYERCRMADLIEWLEGPPMSWPNFFIYRGFLEEEIDRKRTEELKKLDEDWEKGIAPISRLAKSLKLKAAHLPAIRSPEIERDLENFIEEIRAKSKKKYTPDAKPCPRCGTPPEYLIWFQYSSPPSPWANLLRSVGLEDKMWVLPARS